jgi:hypothetical protein
MTRNDTKRKQKNVLAAYKDHYANVKEACEAAGVSRNAFYEWKKKNKEFKGKLEKINELLIGELESLAISRSFEGSDTLLKFLLTKLRPGKYGDKIDVKLNEETLHAFFRGLPKEFREAVREELGSIISKRNA